MTLIWEDRGYGLHQAYTSTGAYVGFASNAFRCATFEWMVFPLRDRRRGNTKRLSDAKRAVERNWAHFLRDYGLTEVRS